MNRYKASALHFLGSAAVMLLVFGLVRWVWFPGPLFYAASGINMMGILVPVDVILGPLITLIIFNPLKKELKRDLAIIFTVQIAFMVYGVYVISSARPAYIALVEKQFFLVAANDLEEKDQKKAKNPKFATSPWLGPELVGTRQPEDVNLRSDLSLASAFGAGLQNLPEYYVPYEQVSKEAQAAAKSADQFPDASKGDVMRLQEFAAARKQQGQNIGFVRFFAKKKVLFAALDMSNGKVVQFL